MPRTPEQRFWDRIRPLIAPGNWYRRIEDASGNLGTPDLLVGRDLVTRYIELKAAGPNAKLDLRPGQQATMSSLHVHGLPAVYMVGSPCGQVRIVGPLTDGDDWREHLLDRWTAPTEPMMTQLFSSMLSLSTFRPQGRLDDRRGLDRYAGQGSRSECPMP